MALNVKLRDIFRDPGAIAARALRRFKWVGDALIAEAPCGAVAALERLLRRLGNSNIFDVRLASTLSDSLRHACHHGHLEAAKLFLQHGASILEWGTFIKASSGNHIDVAKMLLARNSSAESLPWSKYPALVVLGARSGDFNLLNMIPACLHPQLYDLDNALFIAVRRGGDIRVMKRLLEFNPTISSVLKDAVAVRNLKVLRMLLNHASSAGQLTKDRGWMQYHAAQLWLYRLYAIAVGLWSKC
ncbi:hypothetical protein M427DRAFT_63732 [Gonapodya prolifera JEL478]|uniref:Ankyrin n=1 Tax=Gonapodya prolifera (strain JEL478) TaxID=1344416 RepID=A0A138ZYS3_GONPJ|nr:hypothetical protein M427DRAFT_63732 [Gonapodya prolifera JEL478]|eukprot:KXS09657.1 hypothetical protein M427DRAFT_63732 [Gonapodya prolifera JEL478]